MLDDADATALVRLRQPTPNQLAWLDLKAALSNSRLWLELGWNDIVQRYRGSILGPFWLTLSTAGFIAGLGPLYAGLFGIETKQYLAYMALGVLLWTMMASTINECCRAFIDAGPLLKQLKLPRMTVIFHVLWRNIIVVAHNLPVYVAVMLYCGIPLRLSMLWAIPGFLLLFLNLTWIGLLLAIVCLRFRDVVQIVSSVLLLGFFFTPVMWNPRLQAVNQWVVALNPFAAFIDLVRPPLLGEAIPMLALTLSLISLVFGTLITSALFIKCRKQIIYWV